MIALNLMVERGRGQMPDIPSIPKPRSERTFVRHGNKMVMLE
jgi:hypothetical protein